VNHQRFTQLLEAYGTAPAHWPADEREAAQALLSLPGADGVAARAVLDEAVLRDADLTEHLDAYTTALPDEDLVNAILASAPLHGASKPASMPTPTPLSIPTPQSKPVQNWRRPIRWFSGVRLIGAGLLGAGAVGLATGVMTMSLLAPVAANANASAADEPVFGGTVFSSTASDWSDQ